MGNLRISNLKFQVCDCSSARIATNNSTFFEQPACRPHGKRRWRLPCGRILSSRKMLHIRLNGLLAMCPASLNGENATAHQGNEASRKPQAAKSDAGGRKALDTRPAVVYSWIEPCRPMCRRQGMRCRMFTLLNLLPLLLLALCQTSAVRFA